MSVKFQVQMTDKYMYDFMLYHNYTQMSGLIGAVAGVLCLAVFLTKATGGDMQAAMLWLMCAILFLVVNPYNLKTRAKMQVKNTPMFQKPLEYELTEEGVVVRQDDQSEMITWEDFTKAVSTGKSVLLYIGRIRAIIFPKEYMGEQYEEVLKMIHTHMPPKKVKIRHIH
ncbi:MAG: YcxB family protein [Lachnospiraceae bacterium]|nr:YcxB family protein [Lachnospiraceae bacterium]